MTNALKIIALVLSYPGAELQNASSDLVSAVNVDTMTTASQKRQLTQLIDDIAQRDLYEAQERYVHLFDRSRTLSLHLFEHVHGESRDRGQAMVDLVAMYEQNGLAIDAKELPDYLPLFLEFLSILPEHAARELLGETVHILSAIGERLKKRESIYANAFSVLGALAQEQANPEVVRQILEQPDIDPDDLQALDKVWEEEAITFGAGAGADVCGPDRLRTQMRAAQRPPAPTQSKRLGSPRQ